MRPERLNEIKGMALSRISLELLDEIDQLRAEVEELTERFNNQAICAEVFAEARGENVLLRAEVEQLQKELIAIRRMASTSIKCHLCGLLMPGYSEFCKDCGEVVVLV